MNTASLPSFGSGRSTSKWITIGSALFAVALHAYLLKSHYDLRYGEVTGGLMCDISSRFSCSAASASKWSELFGLPLALLGLLTNAALIALAAWDPIADESGRSSNRTGILMISGILVAASVVMAVISVTALNTLCPFCIGTYVLSIITAVSAWFAYGRGLKLEVKPALLGIAIAFGISAFILDDQFRSGYTGPGGDAMAVAAVQEWTQNPVLAIPETDALAKGPSRDKAKFTLAEFADFRCIHCKLAAAPIKAFALSHPDVRVEYYSWPLDGECNTSITQNNGASCLLARTVWCARKKADKGWEAHEKVFERFEEWKTAEAVRSSLDSLALEIGMPAEDLKTCADSEEAKTAITAQARLGSSLNIKGTPAIFVNGKLLPAGTSIPVLSAVHATFP
jgi:protein-disulfide isomerase/uncharacterized membrane protein